MSDSNEKEKHSKRIYQKLVKINKQLEIAKQYGSYDLSQPHRFHKRKAVNCGIPNCVMCANPRKVWKRVTLQEQKHKLKEQDE